LYSVEKLCEGVSLGRIDKGVKCSVSGCGREAARSISTDKVKSAGLKVSSSEKRAYLCREHYKEFKKKTKKDKTLGKWRYSA
jgi:hypothetical protein